MRNAESRFSMLPAVNIRRSSFKRDSRHLTTFNAGKLVPFYLDQDILPGDTHSIKTAVSIRMSTPIHPIMDDLYLDTYYFFIPYRLVWDDLEEFFGENKNGPWTTGQRTIRVPHLTDLSRVQSGSVADYLGIPVGMPIGDDTLSVSALPFRAYAQIWNDWFRSEVVDDYILINKDSVDRNGFLYNSEIGFISDSSLGGQLAPVSKFHDYFTSALPEPQRGEDVMLPISGLAPVLSLDMQHSGGDSPIAYGGIAIPTGFSYSTGLLDMGNFLQTAIDNSENNPNLSPVSVRPINQWAQLDNATQITINQFREALATQEFLEKNARFGTRYTEILRGHFGVRSPDSRLQRTEYLGGKRMPINIQQVLQTSSTDATSPQGNAGAFSWTVSVDDSFTYSAVEHGVLIGVCCIRSNQTYQYGVERGWSRRDLTDFYFPTFAHIGEQAILNKEIYAQNNEEDDGAFGYQEAWAEYRTKPSRVSGAFRSNAQENVGGTLDSWHYAEKLESLPTLSSTWMHQSETVIDRTLAVSSEVSPQFIAAFEFHQTSVRPMPTYSIPGLSTHF